MPVVGERRKVALLPGPMIRVTAGTTVEVAITNTLTQRATVYGLHEHDGRADSLLLDPGTSRTVRFTATRPGTFLC